MDENFDLKIWWNERGCQELNSILVDLVGKGIEWIPLVNLGINEQALSSKNIVQFKDLLVYEGYRIRKLNYEGEQLSVPDYQLFIN